MTAWLKLAARFALSLFYAVAGFYHLVSPEPFLRITPRFVPYPEMVILLTGLCEIAGAVALHIPALRRTAGLLLALYAVCVWPANFKHAFEGIELDALPTSWWYHGPRLALQPVLVALTLWASDWLGKRP